MPEDVSLKNVRKFIKYIFEDVQFVGVGENKEIEEPNRERRDYS